MFLIISPGLYAGGDVPVQNGLLDIRNHNFKTDGIVNISGNWEFYWNKFYSPAFFKDSVAERSYAFVPDFWNDYITSKNYHAGFGYATYHVKILCPETTEQLVLKLLTVESAYKLFVNGELLAERGTAGTAEETTSADLKPAIVKVQPKNNVLDIVMHVSNFHNRSGGLWDLVKLGPEQQLESYTIKNIAIAFTVAGIFLLACIYNFILFLHFTNRLSLLYFSLLCVVIFIRILVTGEIPINYIFSFNWETIRRLEFISLYFSVPVMSLFSYYLFPQDFYRKALYVILPVTFIFIVLSLFDSYYDFTYVVKYYQVIMLITAFYGFYVYIRAAVYKRPGSLLFLSGFILFLATIINDLLYNNLLIETANLFYAGISAFVVILSLLISRQFAHYFSEMQEANKKFAAANLELAQVNNDIKEKNAQLQKINHEMDSFVNRTSHDLRTPIISVAGITELIEHETDLKVIAEYTALQKKTLSRMDDLINDIIDFSKNKRLDLKPDEIDFETIIGNTLADHKHTKIAEGIRIITNIKQYEKFISDSRRLSIIINNLVSNAVKYSDPAKENSWINISVIVADNHATIEVSDNGIGIEESQLDKIFTMFYRATSSATGSGLGLYIIKETVDKLNGYITINSKKGDGTSMKVVIPEAGITKQ